MNSLSILVFLSNTYINITFIEALEKMPKYGKFFKDIITNKHKLKAHEIMMLTEN